MNRPASRTAATRPARLRHLPLCALLGISLNASADGSIGIDPYAPGQGFDRPGEAAWGGWNRCDGGTLFAEWDIFDDASHGAADDRTAAPGGAAEQVAACGVTSAWLGWSTDAANPAFAYNNGNYLYNLSNGGQGGTTSLRINAAGPLRPGLTRVVLQFETRSYPIMPDSLRLNGLKPTLVANTLERDTTINGRPARLFHQLAIWNLGAAPPTLLFDFATEAHTVLQMVALDAGPLNSGSTDDPGQAPVPASWLINLPGEALPPALIQSLHAQRPGWFPAEWRPSQLTYRQSVNKAGTRLGRRLKGSIKALFHDPAEGPATNRVFLDIYRKDPIADIRIAECELKTTQKRRWTRVNIDNRLVRLGTARYALDLELTEIPATSASRFKRRIGQCDIDLDAEGIQAGVPALHEGDYTRLRRAEP